MIETLEYLQLFARFPLALHRFLRHTVTLDEARRTVRDRMQTRDARFLQDWQYQSPRTVRLGVKFMF